MEPLAGSSSQNSEPATNISGPPVRARQLTSPGNLPGRQRRLIVDVSEVNEATLDVYPPKAMWIRVPKGTLAEYVAD